MNHDYDRIHEVLAQIAELASSVAGGDGVPGKGARRNKGTGNKNPKNTADDGPRSSVSDFGCAVKQLPARLLVPSAQHAVSTFPVNGLAFGAIAQVPEVAEIMAKPLATAVMIQKYWGPTPRRLTVSFMDSPSRELRRRIISHLNAWTRTGCIEFVETNGTGRVRISRGPGGYYSYLGTDIDFIPANRQTMNLEGFTMNTPEKEFRRVVRHEAGHTLGFPHEHARRELVERIDPQKAYDYFLLTQGWDRTTVDQQVLTTLDEGSVFGTPPDQDSIMCYFLPGKITRNGRPIPGGLDINESDYRFCGGIYPKPGAHSPMDDSDLAFEEETSYDEESSYAATLAGYEETDWPASEDVHTLV